MSSRWVCVFTHLHGEAKAKANLERQGFAVFYPHFKRRRRHPRKNKPTIIEVPIFARYLFVELAPDAQWYPIKSTLGVRQVVCNGDSPAVVPESLIADLQAREKVHAGDRVRILDDGMFSNLIGVLESMTDRERVTVLLDILSRKVRVELSANLIAAV